MQCVQLIIKYFTLFLLEEMANVELWRHRDRDTRDTEDLLNEIHQDISKSPYVDSLLESPIYERIKAFSEIHDDVSLQDYEEMINKDGNRTIDIKFDILKQGKEYHLFLVARQIIIDIENGKPFAKVSILNKDKLRTIDPVSGVSKIEYAQKVGLSLQGQPTWRPFYMRDYYPDMTKKIDEHLLQDDDQESRPEGSAYKNILEILGFPGAGKSMSGYWYVLDYATRGSIIWCHVKRSAENTKGTDAQTASRSVNILLISHSLKDVICLEDFEFTDAVRLCFCKASAAGVPVVFDGRYPAGMITRDNFVSKAIKIMSHDDGDEGIVKKEASGIDTWFITNWLLADYMKALKREDVCKIFLETNLAVIKERLEELPNQNLTEDGETAFSEDFIKKMKSFADLQTIDDQLKVFVELMQHDFVKKYIVSYKYYYAGGSGRFFFVNTVEDVTKAVTNAISLKKRKEVSTLFAQYHTDVSGSQSQMPVSKYVAQEIMNQVSSLPETFFAHAYHYGKDCNDPVTQGIMFEAYLRCRTKKHAHPSIDAPLVFKKKETAQYPDLNVEVKIDKAHRFDTYLVPKDLLKKKGDGKKMFWAWPLDRKNVGFDFSFIDIGSQHTAKVILFQATISEEHSVKLEHLGTLFDAVKSLHDGNIDVEYYFVSPFENNDSIEVRKTGSATLPKKYIRDSDRTITYFGQEFENNVVEAKLPCTHFEVPETSDSPSLSLMLYNALNPTPSGVPSVVGQ